MIKYFLSYWKLRIFKPTLSGLLCMYAFACRYHQDDNACVHLLIFIIIRQNARKHLPVSVFICPNA